MTPSKKFVLGLKKTDYYRPNYMGQPSSFLESHL